MPLVHSNFFGNTNLITEDPGELVTDIYGLEVCTAVFKCRMDRFDLIPGMFSSHPIFPYLHIERRKVHIKDGWLTVVGEFAGIPGTRDPIYELDLGLSEEAIQTHPRFASEIGGRASSPINGAIFLDFETGKLTTDDSRGVFEKFTGIVGGLQNLFAGISSYLDFGCAVWRKTQMSTSPVTDITTLGHISNPEGPAPSVGSGRNWLYSGATYIQRGLIFSNRQEWKASGRRGWNATIYSS